MYSATRPSSVRAPCPARLHAAASRTSQTGSVSSAVPACGAARRGGSLLELELDLGADHVAVDAGDEAGRALAALGRVARAGVDAEVGLPLHHVPVEVVVDADRVLVGLGELLK